MIAAGFALIAIAAAVVIWLARGPGDAGRQTQSGDRAAGESVDSETASIDPPDTSPAAAATSASTADSAASVASPETTIAPATTTTTSTPSTTSTTAVAIPTTPPPAPATVAQAALTTYFDLLQAGDYTAAYAMWAPGVPDPFDVFVDWWAVDIAEFSAVTHGCADAGQIVECTVEYYLYTSAAARYPNSCQHALFVVAMVPSDGRYLLQGERQSQPLTC